MPARFARSARIAPPDVAVVTNVGYAHIENFESIDDVAAAKRELVEALKPDGTAVLNVDDERVRQFEGPSNVYYGLSQAMPDIELRADGVRFRVDGVQFESAMQGRHAISNILAGIAVARVFGIASATRETPCASLRPARCAENESRAMVSRLLTIATTRIPTPSAECWMCLRDIPAQRKIAVLGEMLELGRLAEPLHREVGNMLPGVE